MGRIVYEIGFNDCYGETSYIVNDKRKKLRSYTTWANMLKRCYSISFHEKYPTYIGCCVSTEWLLYSNFKRWFDINYPLWLSEDIKFELDKDLLGNNAKLYSEDTCLFLPKSVNNFLSNKQLNNTTGYNGVSFDKRHNSYSAMTTIFNTKKRMCLGVFKNPIDAYNVCIDARLLNVTLVKNYLRELGIYSECAISKIK